MGMDAINNATSFQPSKPIEAYQAASAGVEAAQISQSYAQVQNQNPNQQKGADKPTQNEIQSAITSANRRAHFGHTNAQFSYHEETKSISVKIVDRDTNEVIKEIPSEETLEMISKMWELAGIMVDEKR